MTLSTALFGFGAAAVMQQVIQITLLRTRGESTMRHVGKVLAWFLGNGVVGLALVRSTNVFVGVHAEVFAACGYLGGFGLTTGLMVLIAGRTRDPLSKVNAVRADARAETLLLLLPYGMPLEQAAKLLQMSPAEIARAYEDALRAAAGTPSMPKRRP